MNQNIKTRCIEVIKGFVPNENEMKKIESNESILASSSFDSLSIVNLVVKLENEFKINFDTEDFDKIFDNIDSLENYLRSKISIK